MAAAHARAPTSASTEIRIHIRSGTARYSVPAPAADQTRETRTPASAASVSQVVVHRVTNDTSVPRRRLRSRFGTTELATTSA